MVQAVMLRMSWIRISLVCVYAIQTYLRRFGYLNTPLDKESQVDMSEEAIREALR